MSAATSEDCLKRPCHIGIVTSESEGGDSGRVAEVCERKVASPRDARAGSS